MTRTTTKLHASCPRPRAWVRPPAYPRQLAVLGVALSIAASACGGPSKEPVEPIAAGGIGQPYVEPKPIATEPDYAQPPEPVPEPEPDPNQNIAPPGGPGAPYESPR